MYITITRFDVKPSLSRADVARLFEQSLPRYAAVPGLLNKHYWLGEGQEAGGVYLWASREDAESFFTPAFEASIRERFGSIPQVTAMDCPVSLDNVHQARRVELPQ